MQFHPPCAKPRYVLKHQSRMNVCEGISTKKQKEETTHQPFRMSRKPTNWMNIKLNYISLSLKIMMCETFYSNLNNFTISMPFALSIILNFPTKFFSLIWSLSWVWIIVFLLWFSTTIQHSWKVKVSVKTQFAYFLINDKKIHRSVQVETT